VVEPAKDIPTYNFFGTSQLIWWSGQSHSELLVSAGAAVTTIHFDIWDYINYSYVSFYHVPYALTTNIHRRSSPVDWITVTLFCAASPMV